MEKILDIRKKLIDENTIDSGSITPSTMSNIYLNNLEDDVFYVFYQENIKNNDKYNDHYPLVIRLGIKNNFIFLQLNISFSL